MFSGSFQKSSAEPTAGEPASFGFCAKQRSFVGVEDEGCYLHRLGLLGQLTTRLCLLQYGGDCNLPI